MSRHGWIIILGLSTVSAAPVPEPQGAERLKWLYGEPAQASPTHTIELSADDRLQMRLPAGSGRGFDHPDSSHCTLRPVGGDFVATVRLADHTTAGPPAGERHLAVAAAGLVVRGPGRSFVRFSLGRHPGNGHLTRAVTHGLSTGEGGASYFENHPPGPHWLRLSRVGGVLVFERSADGADWWAVVPPIPCPDLLPARVVVGLFADNGGDAPYFVEFDKFTVKPPTAGKK
jgi:regulation of enolase protein 1 (concanavalin A-like superfamily)